MKTLKEKVGLAKKQEAKFIATQDETRKAFNNALKAVKSKLEAKQASKEDVLETISKLKESGTNNGCGSFSAKKLDVFVTSVIKYQPEFGDLIFDSFNTSLSLSDKSQALIAYKVLRKQLKTKRLHQMSNSLDEDAFSFVLLAYIYKLISKEEVLSIIKKGFVFGCYRAVHYCKYYRWLKSNAIDADIFNSIMHQANNRYNEFFYSDCLQGKLDDNHFIFLLKDCQFYKNNMGNDISDAYKDERISIKPVMYLYENYKNGAEREINFEKVISRIVKNNEDIFVFDKLIKDKYQLRSGMLRTLIVGNGVEADNSRWHNYIARFIQKSDFYEKDFCIELIITATMQNNLSADFLEKIPTKDFAEAIKYRITLIVFAQAVLDNKIPHKYLTLYLANTTGVHANDEEFLLDNFDDEVIEVYFNKAYPRILDM